MLWWKFFNFQLIIFFFGRDQTHPLNDPLFHLFHFSTSRFQLPRLSSPLPCASFPSTYPATAEINLRPASTAFTNMCPGRLQTNLNISSSCISFLLTLCFVCLLDLVPVCPELSNPRASPSYFSQYSKRYCLKLFYSWHNHQNQHFNV